MNFIHKLVEHKIETLSDLPGLKIYLPSIRKLLEGKFYQNEQIRQKEEPEKSSSNKKGAKRKHKKFQGRAVNEAQTATNTESIKSEDKMDRIHKSI